MPNLSQNYILFLFQNNAKTKIIISNIINVIKHDIKTGLEKVKISNCLAKIVLIFKIG